MANTYHVGRAAIHDRMLAQCLATHTAFLAGSDFSRRCINIVDNGMVPSKSTE